MVGKIHFSLTDVDLDAAPAKLNPKSGKTLYHVPLVLNIRLGDQAGLLAFRVLSRGKEIAKAELELSYT